MNYRNDGTSTDLYLVRIWRSAAKGDGSSSLHGKLQHVVSGASCTFDALSDLPGVLEKMMEEGAHTFGPEGDAASSGVEDETDTG